MKSLKAAGLTDTGPPETAALFWGVPTDVPAHWHHSKRRSICLSVWGVEPQLAGGVPCHRGGVPWTVVGAPVTLHNAP